MLVDPTCRRALGARRAEAYASLIRVRHAVWLGTGVAPLIGAREPPGRRECAKPLNSRWLPIPLASRSQWGCRNAYGISWICLATRGGN